MRKDGVWSLGLLSYHFSLYHVAAKVCGMSKLMSDYGHGLAAQNRRHKTARVRIRLLLFESTVYLREELSV